MFPRAGIVHRLDKDTTGFDGYLQNSFPFKLTW